MAVYVKTRTLLRLSEFLLCKRLQKKSRKIICWVHLILQMSSTRQGKHILSYMFVLTKFAVFI